MASRPTDTDHLTHVEAVPAQDVREAAAPSPPVLADRIRWGPVWAGLVTTIASFLVLETLFFAVGALTPMTSSTVSVQSLFVQWVIALAAFLAGGVVAAATSSVRGPAVAVLHGFIVWALATSLMLLASLFGAGAAFGAVGGLISRIAPSHLSSVSPAALRDAKTVAAWALLSLLSTAIIAMIGGWLGGFGRPIGHVAREKRRFWE